MLGLRVSNVDARPALYPVNPVNPVIFYSRELPIRCIDGKRVMGISGVKSWESPADVINGLHDQVACRDARSPERGVARERLGNGSPNEEIR
jgi:hypothetical protein